VPIKLGFFPNRLLRCNIGIMGTMAVQQYAVAVSSR
jgi:hypothetical protein